MTIDQNKDDADFAAFLRGEGDLAEGLDALAQPSPSATLDSAILARARADVERDARNARLQAEAQRAREANEARGEAANDAARRSKWGLPGGIAATVLAGVLGHQVWNHNNDVERAAKSPQMTEQSDVVSAPAAAPASAPGAAPVLEAAPARDAAHAPEAAPARGAERASEVAQAPVAATVQKPAAPSEKRSAQIARPVPPAPAPVPAQVAPPASQASVVAGAIAPVQPEAARADRSSPLRYSAPMFERAPAAPAPTSPPVVAPAPPAPPPPPAPAMAAEAAPAADATRHVEVTGSRIIGSSLRARLPATEPDVWLKRISALLASGDKERALVEWRSFRTAYPDYPVAEPTATAIKAAQN